MNLMGYIKELILVSRKGKGRQTKREIKTQRETLFYRDIPGRVMFNLFDNSQRVFFAKSFTDTNTRQSSPINATLISSRTQYRFPPLLQGHLTNRSIIQVLKEICENYDLENRSKRKSCECALQSYFHFRRNNYSLDNVTKL